MAAMIALDKIAHVKEPDHGTEGVNGVLGFQCFSFSANLTNARF
jgi:hypothetical protein